MAKEVLRLKITDLSRACVNDVDGDAQEFLAAGGERDRPKLVMVRSKREAFACRDRRSRQDIVTPHDSSSGAISLNQLVGAEKFSVANSVGFYQITKLLIIPTVMGLERLQGRKSAVYSRKVVLSIVVTAIGVAVATVSDFEMNVRGTILAALSIVSTAQYQIWQGSKQHEHGVTATQITYSVAWPQSIAGLASSLTADVLMPKVKVLILMRPSNLLEHQLSGQGDLFWIALCNILAVCTNISVYGLIGKTSPVTYQVVGQLKTVLVVVFGYIFFDVRVPLHWLMLRFAGVGVAVIGVFSYALCKNAEGREKKS
eukprot:s1600_g4.t2